MVLNMLSTNVFGPRLRKALDRAGGKRKGESGEVRGMERQPPAKAWNPCGFAAAEESVRVSAMGSADNLRGSGLKPRDGMQRSSRSPMQRPSKSPMRRPSNSPMRRLSKSPMRRPSKSPIRRPSKSPMRRASKSPMPGSKKSMSLMSIGSERSAGTITAGKRSRSARTYCVGLTVSYREVREVRDPSTSNARLNLGLMHKVVPNTLFVAEVKRVVDTGEVARRFGVPQSLVERNWMLASAEARGMKGKSLSDAARKRKIAAFSQPVDGRDVTNALFMLQREEREEDRKVVRKEDTIESLCIDSEVDTAKGPTFAAEVAIDKLRYGEVLVQLQAGKTNLELYSNGEVYVDGAYDVCAAGFGSQSVVRVTVETSSTALEGLCSRVSTDFGPSSNVSAEESVERHCDGRSRALVQVFVDRAMYYSGVMRNANTLKSIQLAAHYPRSASGKIGLQKLGDVTDAAQNPLRCNSARRSFNHARSGIPCVVAM